MSDGPVVVTRHEEGWLEMAISRPEVLNALDLATVNALSAALDEAGRDESVRGIILHGAGEKAFVAGADIGELLHRKVDQALEAINAALFQKLEDFPWPTIAAISGYALGGGCELALACDMRIATEGSTFGQPEVKLGIIPGAGAPHRLTRTVGTARARELIFTGRLIDATEAERIGLLNHVVPEGGHLDKARELMRMTVKNSAIAVRLAKGALNAAVPSVDRRQQMIEVLSQGILFESDDKRERMTRFLERKNKKSRE